MTEQRPSHIWMNGQLVAYADAKVHVLAPVVAYGAAVFEGLRAYWDAEAQALHVFRLDDHLARLEQSMRLLGMDPLDDVARVRQGLFDLLAANGIRQDQHIRVLAYVDGEEPIMTSSGPVGVAITALPRGRSERTDQGQRCTISSWQRISDNALPPRVKATANYQNSRYAMQQARRDGYDTPIFLNSRGKVAEGPGSCLFVVRKGRPSTPSVTSDILESITRETLIQLLRDEMGLITLERDVDRTELYVADELFFCGTGYEIVPIASVDGFPVRETPPGPITDRLRSLYFDVVRGRQPNYRHWLDSVSLRSPAAVAD